MGAVNWLAKPQDHDYVAAASYLTLIAGDELVGPIVESLRRAETVTREAKDILRASRLPLLAIDNPHVASDLKKIRKRQSLSPILLVRGDVAAGRPLQIVDGYHRACASYRTDENTPIPCRIVDLPAGG